jgi:quercetin dioxygenase-like cupin family protein
MKLIQKVILVILMVVFVYPVFAGTKPEKTQGLDVQALELHGGLGEQLPGNASDYALRARRIVINPGGTIAEHSHADRPGIVYILEGSMTEHRGDVARVVKPGDTWTEIVDTVHWMENTSDKPCVILAVDLVKK